MLDLPLVTRIKVDEGFDRLIGSRDFVQRNVVKVVGESLRALSGFDAAVIRLYSERGEVVDERSLMLSPGQLDRIPVKVPRKDIQRNPTFWNNPPASSSSVVNMDDYYIREEDLFLLTDAVGMIPLDPKEVGREIVYRPPLHLPGPPPYIRVLLLVYEAPQSIGMRREDMQGVMFSQRYRDYYATASTSFTFGNISSV